MILTNQVLNPSAEGATASLENESASTPTISTDVAVGWPADGNQSYAIASTSTADTIARLRLVERAATVAGKRWYALVTVFAKASNTGARNLRADLVFYNIAPGATAGTVTGTVQAVAASVAPGSSAQFLVSGVAPAATLSVGLRVVRAAGSGAAATDVFYADSIVLAQLDAAGLAFTYPSPGTTPLTYWNGPDAASTSVQYLPQIIANVFPGEDPAPRVQLVVSDLPPTQSNQITIRAVADEEIDRIVRDANQQEYTGTFIVEDAEAPMNLTVTYSLELYLDGQLAGVPGSSVEAVIPQDNPLVAYIADPLDPGSSVRMMLEAKFAETLGIVRDGSFEVPGGSTGGAILLAGASQGLTDIPMNFYTETRELSRAFRDLQRQTPIAALRIAAPIDGFPRTLYVALLNPKWQQLDADGFTLWTWISRQLLAPAASVVVPLHSYDDYMAVFNSYQEAMNAFVTYVDAILNPPPAV